ncbi:MAG: DUF2911 domain-containing protein [Cyclobacteriaceae bacterium]
MKNILNFVLLVSSVLCTAQSQTDYVLPEIPANLAAPSNSSLTLPRVSQKAVVNQVIGITEITVSFHRPGIYGRTLLGGAEAMIPYGQVWRAGANENTTINFSHDTMIAGKMIEAGTYGLFLLPEEESWTLILSKSNTDWGSFFYDQNNDALRAGVVYNESDDYVHWLSYSFKKPQYDKVDLELAFGKVRVTIPIEVNSNEIIVKNLQRELNGVSMRNIVAYNQAAQFCLTHKIQPEVGLAWSQRAVRNERSFTHLMTASGLHHLLGETQESEKLKEEAFSNAEAGDLVNYGFELMGAKLDKNRESALEAFQLARELRPDGAFPMFAMGKYYESQPSRKKKDVIEAIRFYEMARENTQVEGLKRRMDQVITLLEDELN